MNKVIGIIVYLFTSTLYSQSINDSLLLHYTLDGNAIDTSGNGYNGIVNASLIADRFGSPNSAYSFNGNSDYIDFPNSIQLKPNLPVSFSFWMKFDNLQPQNTVLFSTNRALSGHSGVWMNLSSTGRLAINYGDTTGGTSASRRTKVGTTALNTNTWYHIIGIVNSATDMKLYIDCIDDGGSYSGSGGNLAYTTDQGSLGRKENLYFMGNLDDFSYWNRELNVTDVNYLCNNIPSSTIESALIHYKVSIYPNPVENVLHIEVENIEVETVIIHNSLGQMVFQGKFQKEIKVNHLESGIFFIELIDNNKNRMKVIKMIKH